ncbi:MAG: DUF3021 domain-containing protein [Clostridia bacterium]|nr:DUF3021 domain-containing protein [Clostridia bacterium]
MLSGRKNILKEFLTRGAVFGGLGPIIVGIVYLCISMNIADFSLSAIEVLLAIISGYLLAFIQAGASVFNQIDSWSPGKSLLFHFTSIYLAYIVTYLINRWIPFNIIFILIFTGGFVAAYFIVWITVYLCVKATQRKLNRSIEEKQKNKE